MTDFIREWRHSEGQDVLTNAFVPLAFDLGEAFQFDWSEEGLAVGGSYHNLKTAVDKVHKGEGRTVNLRFAVMCAHYLFDPDFCDVASGWEKPVLRLSKGGASRRTCRTQPATNLD